MPIVTSWQAAMKTLSAAPCNPVSPTLSKQVKELRRFVDKQTMESAILLEALEKLKGLSIPVTIGCYWRMQVPDESSVGNLRCHPAYKEQCCASQARGRRTLTDFDLVHAILRA